LICFVYLEHPQLLQDPNRKVPNLARCLEAAFRLEAISGEPCLIQHYSRLTRQRLVESGVRALIVSGNSTPWEAYSEAELDELRQIVRSGAWPILGICGGWQQIAKAYGGALRPMRRLRPDEADAAPEVGPGFFKEWGYLPVQVTKPDPLFEGLGRTPVFFQAHYCEAWPLPPGFEALASTAECGSQAGRLAGKPVYGIQFHAEQYSDGYPDGRRLLVNFFRIAGLIP
jgi:GMP synthase (glutamine-hydrolysing)